MGRMVRVLIIGIVVAVAFTLYALVDSAMTDGSRARGVSKPVWVVLIVLLPVIGALLWFTIGKGSETEPAGPAPDDDPRFTAKSLSDEDLDRHMQDLEARLRELDDEVFPGEGAPTSEAGSGRTERPDASPADTAPSEATEPDDDASRPSGPLDEIDNGSAGADSDASERPEQDRS